MPYSTSYCRNVHILDKIPNVKLPNCSGKFNSFAHPTRLVSWHQCTKNSAFVTEVQILFQGLNSVRNCALRNSFCYAHVHNVWQIILWNLRQTLLELGKSHGQAKFKMNGNMDKSNAICIPQMWRHFYLKIQLSIRSIYLQRIINRQSLPDEHKQSLTIRKNHWMKIANKHQLRDDRLASTDKRSLSIASTSCESISIDH